MKRIVGAPGDHVELRDGAVFLNGQPIAEPYVNGQPTLADARTGLNTWDLGAGQYFVLGDNRVVSADSRAIGAVDFNMFIGRVTLMLPAGPAPAATAPPLGVPARAADHGRPDDPLLANPMISELRARRIRGRDLSSTGR